MPRTSDRSTGKRTTGGTRPGCGRVARYAVAGFTVCDFALPGDYRMDAHEHRRSGIVLPLRGRFRARIGSRDLDAADDRVVVLPAGAPHRETTGDVGSRCLLVLPRSRGRHEKVEMDLDTPRSTVRPDLARLGRVLHRELRETGEPAAPVAESLLLELFASRPIGSLEAGAGSPGWMERVLEMIRDRFAESIEHEEIAREAGVSREHLARTFRGVYGLPLGAYVRKLRVLEAARRLREDDRPIARIAARCGFADHSHLARTFRRHFDLTPTEYRSRVGSRGRRST